MNEKEILAHLKRECEVSAPDDFQSIRKKISKSKHQINVFFKIAAAVAIFALPIVSVCISNHFNSIDNNKISIAEIAHTTDITTASSDKDSSTVLSSSSISKFSDKAAASLTSQSKNSNTTTEISQIQSPVSTLIHHPVFSQTPGVITDYPSTQTPKNTDKPLPPDVTSIVPSTTDAPPHNTDISVTQPDPPPSDMDVSNVPTDQDVPEVTQTSPDPADESDESSPLKIKSFKLIVPDSFQESAGDDKIFKGINFYYHVDHPNQYTVIVEHFDSSTEKLTVSEAIDANYVSIEHLIQQGLYATIQDTVK